MKNPDKLWFDIAYRFSEQSRCKSRKVGCVIVYENRLIGQGWNSAPEGSTTDDCPRERCRNPLNSVSGTDLSYAICCHAEASAIGYCARHGISSRGASVYVTHKPCAECSKLLVAAGIKEVVYDQDYNSPLTDMILNNAKITLRKFRL